MKLKLLVTVVAILTFSLGNSQNSFWTTISDERINEADKLERTSIPSEYQLFRLDFEGIKNQLKKAPTRNFGGITPVSNVVISFPNAEGELEQFRIYESSVMEAELAEKHQEIQSYVGQGIDNPTARMYLTTTIFGLHAMTISSKGASYIDTHTRDLKNYIVYNKSSLTTTKHFQCNVEDTVANTADSEGFEVPSPVTMASDGLYRTYRLAMACTIEYAAYHVNAAGLNSATEAVKKAAVLAAMNVTVARVNSVYEIDMSLRMVLVASNTNIIFITTDNFNNSDANTLINQSQSVINSTIGFMNYDIGHTVSTGAGGLAQSPSVCGNFKARGVTGSSAPVGDPFDIDYVAHEIGHQFGASHTFNNSCGGNRENGFAVEPGSGSTIMAYAGICPVNVQNNSDDYFHAVSIAQMMEHITGAGDCVEGVTNGNSAPVIQSLADYTIPIGTAFILRGNATDDESTLTYCWEQRDSGATVALPSASTTTANPNFRSRMPSESPNRYMPSLQFILSNSLTNPISWEIIPNVNRTMNFALTVRDNQLVNGGQTSRDDMIVTFTSVAGPFKVTSQNTAGITWTSIPQNITWDVANTTASPINTANVNILLSTDGGLTYPITLAANTPNDGNQLITVPNVTSSTCRIMIEAVGNIFLAVNSTQFAIDNELSSEDFSLENFKLYPNPNTGNFNIEFNSTSSNDVKIAIYDIQGRQIFDRSYPNTGMFSQNLDLNNVQSGVYLVNIFDGNQRETRKIIIN
ncbi:zinc-dependent metalloprotease [Flavobacterium soli]|uniref:zinc-dependent metalloprotease n=1 Tax=Flavobacterium soli TaxID=344881 RepID=UPI00040DFB5E|nr:zinc-dependent metalloprotease family protein [Flavobacterium soli]